LNLVYLVLRHRDDLPEELQDVKESIEKVLPDVKNIDRYGKEGTILLCSLAAISLVFDVVLYAGVDHDQYSMIWSAWAWGIVDCSFDFVIGIASGNMTFMDTVALAGIKQYSSNLAIHLELKEQGLAYGTYESTVGVWRPWRDVALTYPRQDSMPTPRRMSTSFYTPSALSAPYPLMDATPR
ncbi:unnamed protein product, partial [Ixodes hexagonus]